MEMEHINDNTIRVVIENADLEDRGVTFLDLMGNQKEIEKFFYSILEEVDVDDQFRDTDAVTFQVLPNRNGLELFISKNLNLTDGLSIDETTTGPTEDVSEFLKERMEAKKAPIEDNRPLWLDQNQYVYEFDDFETLVTMASEITLNDSLTSVYSLNDKYYFVLTYLNHNITDYEKEIDRAVLLEYAKPSHLTDSYLGEHGKKLMQRSALELMQHYFK